MAPNRWLPALLMLLISSGGMAQVPSEKCVKRCGPLSHEPAFIEIDANTGQILGGATRFAQGEKVQVIVTNKNPFKYVYRVQVVSSPIDQAIIGTFLRFIPGPGSLFSSALALPNPQAAPVPTPDPLGITERSTDCDPATLNRWQVIKDEEAKLVAAVSELKMEAKDIADIHKEYEKFVQDTDKDALGAQCPGICDRADALSGKLDKLTELDAFKKKIELLRKSAGAVQVLLGTLSADEIKDCQLADGVAAVKSNITNANDTAKLLEDDVKKLEAVKASIEAMTKIIRAAVADENAFREQHFPYTGAGPTNVRITIFRTNLREENATEKQVTAIDLTVGQSRFSISAGVGFSTLEDVRIIRDGKKFGEENRSSLRPSLAVMLNAQFGNLWRWYSGTRQTAACPACPPTPKRALPVSWGISTGLVVSNRNDTTQTEFILGPTLGLLDNNLFMTFGLHLAQVEKLGGGFEIGQEIPSDLTGEPPVKNDWEKGFMLAVTYKLR